MAFLQRFEQRLEQAVAGVFAKAFRSAVQPVEVAAALQREVDNSAQILSRNRRLVPNQFHVELSPQDHARLAPYSSTLIAELTEILHEHAGEQAYVFTGPVTIAFDEREDLTTGRFRVRSAALSTVTPTQGSATDTAVRRAQVLLEVNGMRHPLDPPGLVVGRGSDADLRIDDPGVSRRHVEIRVDQPDGPGPFEVSVVDLGSTNGMLVDGERVTEAELSQGGTVKIGNTTMRIRFAEPAADPQPRSPWGDSGV